jgi:hypothetical protein
MICGRRGVTKRTSYSVFSSRPWYPWTRLRTLWSTGEKGVEVGDLYRLQKSRAGLHKGHTPQMIREGCNPG